VSSSSARAPSVAREAGAIGLCRQHREGSTGVEVLNRSIVGQVRRRGGAEGNKRMKAMVQAPRDRAAPPEAHEGGAPARPKKRAAVQWAPRSLLGFDSLTMSSPGDASEREADAAAQRLVQGLPAQVGALPRVGVQRRCAACASAPATPCATCGTREEEPPPIVQRRATGIRSAFLGIPVVPFGGGAPLPGEVRSTFGRLLGHDLSGVRVHTGVEAARSAEGLSAEAYTVGDDVVFAAGRYAPQTPRGRELLAHELAHVAQQRGGAPRIQRQVSSARRPPSSCEAPSALTSQGGPLSVYRFVRGTTTFIDDLSDAARRYPPTARVIIHGAASEEEWQGVSPAESLRRNQRLACERALAARAVFAFQAPEVRVEHVVNHGQLSGDAEWHRIVAIEALPSQRPPHSEPPQEVRGPEPPPARRPSIDAGLPPLHPAHTCGPNITESFRQAVTEIRAAFIARGDDTRTACAWATFESQDSWDIEELYGSTLSSNAARYVAPSGCGFSDLPVRYGGVLPNRASRGWVLRDRYGELRPLWHHGSALCRSGWASAVNVGEECRQSQERADQR
jgi:hypothetical protein